MVRKFGLALIAAALLLLAGQPASAAVIDEATLPSGRIEVTFTNALTGAAVANVCFWATSKQDYGDGCSDATGRAVSGPLTVGVYSIGTSNQYPAYLNQAAQGVQVRAGETTAVPLVLRPAARLVVTVRDRATGLPHAGACLWTTPADRNLLTRSGTPCSSSAGRIVLDGYPAGKLRLFVEPDPGSGMGAQWVGTSGGTGDMRAAKAVELVSGGQTDVDVKLDPGGSITGLVRSARTGRAAGGVQASVTAIGPTWLREDMSGRAVTDANGRYTIADVGPYAWPVQFVDDGGGLATQWSGGASDRLGADPVQVRAGKTAVLNARLAAGGTISGRVRNALGNPAAANVHLFNATSGDWIGYAYSGTVGAFSVTGLATQQVRIQTGDYLGGDLLQDPQLISVRSGEATTGVEVRLP